MNDAGTIEKPNTGAALADPSRGLSVVSIAKSYDRKAVLSDVSLGVDRGEVLGLLGPNGAGKTTCFYSIMGLVRPDSGRILMDGIDVTKLPMYRRAILGLKLNQTIVRVKQMQADLLGQRRPDPKQGRSIGRAHGAQLSFWRFRHKASPT